MSASPRFSELMERARLGAIEDAELVAGLGTGGLRPPEARELQVVWSEAALRAMAARSDELVAAGHYQAAYYVLRRALTLAQLFGERWRAHREGHGDAEGGFEKALGVLLG